MVYRGSKKRLKKYILPIIQKCIDDNDIKTYVEPFVGGANIIDSVNCKTRIGSDINYYLIAILNYMKQNPNMEIFKDECSKEHYIDVKESYKNNLGKYSDAYIGGIGFFASFSGNFFDSYNCNEGKRNRYQEVLRNARKQAPLLKNIDFCCSDYTVYEHTGYKNCVFYLDAPYRNTRKYGSKFDFGRYYDFCRNMSKDNFVFISEYEMPSDFKCIFEKEIKDCTCSSKIKAIDKIEKLFILR